MTDLDLYDAGEYQKNIGEKSYQYKYLTGSIAANEAHTIGSWDLQGYQWYSAVCYLHTTGTAAQRDFRVLGSLEVDYTGNIDDKADTFFPVHIVDQGINPNNTDDAVNRDKQLDTRRFSDEGTVPLIRCKVESANQPVNFQFLLRVYG